MKNNKGFTLVEVIGVITLLIVIALVTYPGLIKTIKENKEASYDSKVKDIIIAAKTYNSLNGNNYTQIALSELINEKYLDKMINPNNNNEMNGCIYVENNEYRYEEVSCSSSIDKEICNYDIGQVWNFDYTGGEQVFVVPCTGTYKLETWGAQGGNSYSNYVGGKGAYVSGNTNLNINKNVYIYVGGVGTTNGANLSSVSGNYWNQEFPRSDGGYNGGGSSGNQSIYNGSGGGSTDIRLQSGSFDDFNSIKTRIMVAAGGGGASYYESEYYGYGGSAGGLIGYDGTGPTVSYDRYGGGGQKNTTGYNKAVSAGFGYGGYTNNFNVAGGGGSGYYGGSSGHDYGAGGGGGSSFISGHVGCDAIKEESTVDNIIHTGQPIHYSGYKFTDTVMIDGEGYIWTTQKGEYVGQPQPNGTIDTGHKGNGYAKITLVSY